MLLLATILGCGGGCTPPDPIEVDVTPTPTDPPDPTDDPGLPLPDCSAYAWRGVTYDCATVDRCDDDASNLQARLACCDCDPRLCLQDPACPTANDPPIPPVPPPGTPEISACMACHNHAEDGDPIYAGDGLSNPHAYGSAAYIDCTSCHGGDGSPGNTRDQAHVPPPTLSDVQRRTLAGIEDLPTWPDPRNPGSVVEPLDWLQFRNPGDLRVVAARRGCGTTGCHGDDYRVALLMNPMATNAGVYAGADFSFGAPVGITAYQGLWNETAASIGIGATEAFDPLFYEPQEPWIGFVPRLDPHPDPAVLSGSLAAGIDVTGLDDDVIAEQLVAGSQLQDVLHAVTADVCSDCHLGTNGENQGYGALRSSGCSACHMPYAENGRTRALDPFVYRDQPDEDGSYDATTARPRIDAHQIRSVGKITPYGGAVLGIEDRTCGTCHTGTNQTLLQYWGVRIDPVADVAAGTQYPQQPVWFSQVHPGDQRFFNGANLTWQGWMRSQLLLVEDYDGDSRDDTPPDVHYEAGLACIDCHGTADIHGPIPGWGTTTPQAVRSRAVHANRIRCESCHGDLDGPAATTSCVDYRGQTAACAMDADGVPLRNVTDDGAGGLQLRSRIDGRLHDVPLVSELVDPTSADFSANASYAMGRLDDDPTTGTGPVQQHPDFGNPGSGFAHTDVLTCDACHSTWSTQCVACHLTATYSENPASFFFSSLSGLDTVIGTTTATTYQTPVLHYLGVGPDGRITNAQLGSNSFFQVRGEGGAQSRTFAFADRLGNGNSSLLDGRSPYPALAHNQAKAHTTRGAATIDAEGVKPCQVCHNTVEGLAADPDGDGTTQLEEYLEVRQALDSGDFAALPFDRLAAIASDTQNDAMHPLHVAATAGLGSGLFLFDADGCPVNPLDDEVRPGCVVSPADAFPAPVAYDLDRFVEWSGVSNASSSIFRLQTAVERDGALYPDQTGPLGATTLQRLADPVNGIVLDGWIDAEGIPRGTAE